MSEILISFELMTILYIVILVPVLVFLIVFAYRIAKSLEIGLLERWNRRIVNENKKVILENIKTANELIDVQRELRKELELGKKMEEMCDE
jgi:hypothetical protein